MNLRQVPAFAQQAALQPTYDRKIETLPDDTESIQTADEEH